MLFNFQLRPLEAIVPWGDPPHEQLHWFGLTDGWYWMEVGETCLFQYSDAIIQYYQHEWPNSFELPYADYQIVRFWEDMLDILPSILEPLPESLIQELNLPHGFLDWWQQVNAWFAGLDDAAFATYEQPYYTATQWISERLLPTLHLAYSPQIGFWNTNHVMHIWWDHRGQIEEGRPIWAAQTGAIQLPLETFIAEVQAFHDQLMQAMDTRVQQCVSAWPFPTVGLDRKGLVREHQDRTQWLSRTLLRAEKTIPTDWDTILEAIRLLKQLIPR